MTRYCVGSHTACPGPFSRRCWTVNSRIPLVAVAALPSCDPSVLAQTAQISGRVSASTGAVIPAAAITVTNQNTGIATTTASRTIRAKCRLPCA